MTGAQDAKQLRRRRGVVERVYERNQQFRVVEQREQVGQPLVRVSALAGRPVILAASPLAAPRRAGDDEVAQRSRVSGSSGPATGSSSRSRSRAVRLRRPWPSECSWSALGHSLSLLHGLPGALRAAPWLAAHRRPGYLDNHEIGVPPCLGDSPQAHPVISVVHPARTSCCLTSQPRIMPRARSRASHWRTGGPLAGSDSLRFAPAVSGCHAAGVQVKVGGGDAQGTVSGARCAQR